MIVALSLLVVIFKYRIDISKMDGAGFVPLFQRQLCTHIAQLPQGVLDRQVESDLLAMMEKDVQRLNDVISAFFELVGALLELAFLLPVLSYLSR